MKSTEHPPLPDGPPGNPDRRPPCERVRARLERLVDDGLDPLEAARDRGHLEACEACAAELAAWEGLVRSVRDASDPAPDELAWALEGLEPRLVEAAAVGRRRRFRVLVGRGLAAAGTVAAAVVGLAALEAGGMGLDSLPLAGGSGDLTAELLPNVEIRLPDWAELFEPEVR